MLAAPEHRDGQLERAAFDAPLPRVTATLVSSQSGAFGRVR